MTALLSIGDLAERTGVPVRTIRFYSDSGVLPPAERTGAGYRLYDEAALARLGLVRTLRDLGIDLATIRRVLQRESVRRRRRRTRGGASTRRSACCACSAPSCRRSPAEAATQRRCRPCTSSPNCQDEERRRIVADFLDHVFEGLDVDPAFEARMRSAAPELPDDPSPEQVDAWIELAELVQDDDFRASIRRMSETGRRRRAPRATCARSRRWWRSTASAPARPASSPARPRRRRRSRRSSPRSGTVARSALADRLEAGTDARAERYWQLLATVNGWPPVPTTVPAWEWVIAALRAG